MAQKSLVNTRLTPKPLKKFLRPDKPLAYALLQAMEEKFEEVIDGADFDGGRAIPIAGHELDYQKWLRTYAPHAASSEPWHASPHPSTPRMCPPSARPWTWARPTKTTGSRCLQATTSPNNG